MLDAQTHNDIVMRSGSLLHHGVEDRCGLPLGALRIFSVRSNAGVGDESGLAHYRMKLST